MLHFFWTLRDNPIYLRERGRWGQPNHFFSTLRRYSPFIVMGAIIIGMCSTSYGVPMLMAMNDELVAFWVLVCLPTFVVQILLIGALITVPTLTTPLVSGEKEQGTWEILRLTPQPMLDLLLAKMLGALARVKWLWVLLLIGTLLQTVGSVLGMLGALAFAGDDLAGQVNMTVVTFLLTVLLVTRPWAEIAFIALLGLVLSTIIRSTRLGLATCYITLFITRTLNGNFVWGIVALAFGDLLQTETTFAIVALAPSMIYLLSTAVLLLILIWRAHVLTMSNE